MRESTMNGPWFLEVLSRTNQVLARHRHEQLPIRIGRAYDNDVILNDPHIAPHHAQIEARPEVDGVIQPGVQVRDLGSKNGIVQQNQPCQQLTLDGDQIFRLGHTRLRLRDASYPVPAEKPDSTNHAWEGTRPASVGMLLMLLCAIGKLWLLNTEENTAINYALTLLSIIGIAMLWVLGWGLMNRLIDGQARLGRHVFIIGCGVAAFELWNVISTTLAYAFSFEFLTAYSSLVHNSIGIAVISFHVLTIVPLLARRVASVGAIMTLLSWGFNLMDNYQRSGMLADELYMSQILPPGFRLSPNHSVESFFDKAKQLQAKADKEAKKPAKGNAGDGE